MINFTVIPHKAIWHFSIWQNWRFGQFYHSKIGKETLYLSQFSLVTGFFWRNERKCLTHIPGLYVFWILFYENIQKKACRAVKHGFCRIKLVKNKEFVFVFLKTYFFSEWKSRQWNSPTEFRKWSIVFCTWCVIWQSSCRLQFWWLSVATT